MANDSLGDRMKNNYENRFRYHLPRRTYTIIRIDGKAFHTYTSGMERPFDDKLMTAMDNTTHRLCANIQGCQLGYVQSDEISLLLTDFEKDTTDAWFDGNLQKISSVSASMATAYFNQEMGNTTKLAFFDARVFCMSDNVEVSNYFLWRQKDWERNSISLVANSLYSHKELQGMNCNIMQEMIFQKGINWNDYESRYKRGRIIYRQEDGLFGFDKDIPIFSKNPEYLSGIIPRIRED